MDAVIFDIDGTLLQSDTTDDTLYLAAVREVLGNVKVRPSWGMYTQYTAAGILAEILGDNAIEVTPETVAAVRDCFVAGVGCHVSARGPFAEVPGAKAFVQSLHKSTTHRVAYATGGWHGAAQLKLSASEFPVMGIPLATSDDHIDRQEIMLHALRQLGGAFDTVTYYGMATGTPKPRNHWGGSSFLSGESSMGSPGTGRVPPDNQMRRTCQSVTPLACARAAPVCHATDAEGYRLIHGTSICRLFTLNVIH